MPPMAKRDRLSVDAELENTWPFCTRTVGRWLEQARTLGHSVLRQHSATNVITESRNFWVGEFRWTALTHFDCAPVRLIVIIKQPGVCRASVSRVALDCEDPNLFEASRAIARVIVAGYFGIFLGPSTDPTDWL